MRIKNRGCKCSFENCSEPAFCKKLCKKHYKRLSMRKYRYGREHLVRREGGTGNITRGYLVLTEGSRRTAAHILVAEKALGKRLPKGAVVHHVDRNRSNNNPNNLVICPNQSYHMLIHKRMRDLGYD